MSERPDPRVLEAMRPYFSERFGNPSSRNHAFGEEAHLAVEAARQAVATLIGAPSARGVVFTSGGIESDRLAVHGALEAIPSAHPARWIDAASGVRSFFRRPVDVVLLETLELPEFAKALLSGPEAATTLISLRVKNDEDLGRVADVSAMCIEHGALLHVSSDVPIFQGGHIDLLSIDGTAIGAPAGVGVLHIRRRSPPLRIQAQVPGGGQEGGLRGGTLNVPGIVGLGAAATFAHAKRSNP